MSPSLLVGIVSNAEVSGRVAVGGHHVKLAVLVIALHRMLDWTLKND